jgi:hypothetical protein
MPEQAAAPAPKRSRAVIVLIPAVVIGVVIGIAMAVGGGDDKPKDEKVSMHAGATDETPTAVETGSSQAAATPGSAQQPVVTDPTPTKPADTAAGGAKPTEPTNTAKPDDTAHTEAKPDDTAKPDATTKPVETTQTKPDDKTTKKPNNGNAAHSDGGGAAPANVDVAALYKASRFMEAVSQCSSSSKVVASNSTVCTMAACKAKDAAKAKKWLGSVSSAKRASVIKDCGGVLPAEGGGSSGTSAPTDKCKGDWLNCQH